MTVSEITTLSPERRELRAHHVGASEVAALFDLHAHLTRFELWHRKAGNLPEDDLSDNERVFWGTILEPAIGRGVAERTGWKVRKVRRYVAHPTIEGMGSSPDFEVYSHPRGTATLQIKNVDASAFREWEDGKPPMAYQLQVQHEIACGRYAWGALACLVGGNQLEIFEYGRHEAAIAKIESAVAEFWQSVRDDIEPTPDFERDLSTLRSIFSVANDTVTLDLRTDEKFTDACRRYVEAGAAEREAGKAKDAAKAEILATIRDAGLALATGYKVTSSNVAEQEIAFKRPAYRTVRCTAAKQPT
jgi:predicted phage-related endonuclease